MIIDSRSKQPQPLLSPDQQPRQAPAAAAKPAVAAASAPIAKLAAAPAPAPAAAAKGDHAASAPKASQFAAAFRRPARTDKPATDEPAPKQQLALVGSAADEAPKGLTTKLFGNFKNFVLGRDSDGASSEPKEVPREPVERLLTAAERRFQDLRDAIVIIEKYFEDSPVHPSSPGLRAGHENRRLHNLVRGQLCTKLYLVLQDGLRLKTSNKKPHVWQFLALMASLLKKQLNVQDSDEEFDFAACSKSPNEEFIRVVQGINEFESLQSRNDTKYRALVVHGLNTKMLYRWTAIFDSDTDAVDNFYEPNSVMREQTTRDQVSVLLERLKHLPFEMSVDYEIAMEAK